MVDLQEESWDGIKTVFCELATSISDSLQERNVQPKQLVGCLVGWFEESKILKEEKENVFLQVKELCEESKSFEDCWSIILNYITFYSYKLLKAIVNSKFTTKKDKEKFEKYEKHFLRYSTEVVAKYASNIDYSKCDGVTEVIVKIKAKFRLISEEHLDKFKEKLAVAIQVLSEHLHLIDLRPGCTELTYHAPLIVEVAAFPLSALQEAALLELGVIWLQCGNYRFSSEVRTLYL